MVNNFPLSDSSGQVRQLHRGVCGRTTEEELSYVQHATWSSLALTVTEKNCCRLTGSAAGPYHLCGQIHNVFNLKKNHVMHIFKMLIQVWHVPRCTHVPAQPWCLSRFKMSGFSVCSFKCARLVLPTPLWGRVLSGITVEALARTRQYQYGCCVVTKYEKAFCCL